MGQGGGQGGVDGGGHQRAVWEQQGVHWFHLLSSLKNLTIGLIWLVTRGEAWGVWAREAGKGVDTREQCGSNTLKNLTIGLIWLVTMGGVGQGGGQGGVDGGGAPESSVGATRRSLVPPFGLP